MAGIHRVTITDELYETARQYMVRHRLPHVRAAVEALVKAGAVVDGLRHTQQKEVGGNDVGREVAVVAASRK